MYMDTRVYLTVYMKPNNFPIFKPKRIVININVAE